MLNLPAPQAQRGASLIEVLVTMLLLSFAMLAMANMHAMSLKYVKMAEFRGIATELALDMSDRMRANGTAGPNNNYTYTAAYSSTPSAVTVPACANAARCLPAEMAAIDLAEIRNTARLSLPGGGLRIERDATTTSIMNLWIIWQDPDGPNISTCPAAISTSASVQCVAMRVGL